METSIPSNPSALPNQQHAIHPAASTCMYFVYNAYLQILQFKKSQTCHAVGRFAVG